MSIRANLARAVAVVCALSGLLIAVPGHTALAVGEASGTGTVNYGPEGSGTVTWDASAKTVTIKTVAGTLASGKCVTTWFDWYTSGQGHYDARAVRVCKSGQTYTHTWTGERSRVTGLQKLAVCYGLDQQSGTCKVDPRAVGAGGSPNFCNFTTGSYRMKSDGTVQVCTGGDPTSSTS